jgi:hypothetical protein
MFPSDSHPFPYPARRPVVARRRASKPAVRRKVLVAVARVKRFLNGQVAAAIAHHEQQAELFAQRKLEHRSVDSMRLYHSPIDQLLAKAATLRKHAA